MNRARLERGDIKILELYDAASIMAIVSLESSGFAERGKAWQLLERRELSLSGALPCNTFGGLKARSHLAIVSG